MANDIEITVKVANHSNAGLASTTQSLNRLRASARETANAMGRLRASMTREMVLRARLDNTTDAEVTRLKEAVRELRSTAPIGLKVRLDSDADAALRRIKAAVRDLRDSAPIRLKVRLDSEAQAAMSRIKTTLRDLRDTAPIRLPVRLDSNAVSAVGEIKAVLRELRGTGPVRLSVRLDNRTRAGITEVRASIRALKAESPIRLEARFSGSATQIVAAARAMRSLRSDSARASTALGALAGRALAAAAALEALKVAALDASNALRTLRGRASAVSAAMTDLRTTTTAASSSLRTMSTRANTTDSRMDVLSNRTHALSNNMDSLDNSLRRVGGSMSGLRGNVGSLGSGFGGASGGSRKLLMAALALAPALVPITAAVAPLVPALGAAGMAMGAFGAALLPQILAIGKLGEAHKAYKEAVAESGETSKEAGAAQNAWLKEVSKAAPEVRQAAAALSVMKDEYKEWTDSLNDATLPVATKSFGVLAALFPKMSPLVRAASAEFSRLMDLLNVGVHSKGFDEFMIKLADFSQRTLRSAIDGMMRFGQAMNRGIQSDGFREFLTYVRESGPVVGETLANLGRALMKIIAAAADTGVGILVIVNAFARLIDAIPTDLLSAMLQMAFAFKALQLAAVGFGVIGPAMLVAAAGVRDFIRAARFAGVASAISGVVQQMTLLQRASIVIGVVVGIAVAINELAERARGAPPDVDRLTTSLKELAGSARFGGELKKTFGDMDGLVDKMRQIGVETQKAGEAAKGAFGFKIPVLDDIGNWLGTKFTEMRKGGDSLRALEDDFKSLDTALSNLATSGHGEMAAESFNQIAKAAAEQGYTLEQLKELFPQYGDAVAALQADQELAARSMGLFGDQAIAVQAKLDMQRQSAEGLRQSINALNEVYLQARGGVRAMEAAIDAASESLKKNGKTLDENTEKGRANNQALDDLAGATMKAAEAALANGQGWDVASGIWERGRAKLIETAGAMGLNEDQARALANQILATPDKTAVLRGNMEDLQGKLNSARAQLAVVPDSRKAEIRANIADLEAKIYQARSLLGGMKTDYQVRIHYIRTGYIPSGGHDFEGYAHGGVIGAAGGGPRSRMTLVGEQGPELVDLAPGSRVRSNPDSRRIAAGMAGGGGGGPAVLEIRSSGSRIDDLIVEILRRSVRNNGGDVQIHLGGRRS